MGIVRDTRIRHPRASRIYRDIRRSGMKGKRVLIRFGVRRGLNVRKSRKEHLLDDTVAWVGALGIANNEVGGVVHGDRRSHVLYEKVVRAFELYSVSEVLVR
jgi:hypothetical protein